MSDVLTGFAFRRFEVLPDRRELMADGRPIRIGARAFDVLVVLLESPGVIVPKAQLLRRVWGKVHVQENSVEAQIRALRIVLGEDRDAIATLPGRGYRLEADVRQLANPSLRRRLPADQPGAFIGHERERSRLIEWLADRRPRTITALDGIGQTRLGVEPAQRPPPKPIDDGYRTDRAKEVEPGSIRGAVAEVMGGPDDARQSEDPYTALRSLLMLLVLDDGDHLVEAMAPFIETLLQAAPRLHILATRQVALGVKG